jgi:hypothetical protein
MHSQPIDRAHPGCIAILVDQSGSMDEPFAGGSQTKAEALAEAVNRLLRNLVLQCQRGEEIRDYYQLALVGYGNTVGTAWAGALKGQNLVPITQVADFPLRLESDRFPGEPEVSLDIPIPIWLEPNAGGGTPMTQAIDLAGAIVVDWANANFDSFPPIVINISDGAATDGDPRSIAASLRDIHTRDGNLLFFNVNLSSSAATPVQYPSSPQGLPDSYARTLFEMSSELTPYMLAVARGMGFEVGDGAHGFVLNADGSALSDFLNVGTQVSQVADR